MMKTSVSPHTSPSDINGSNSPSDSNIKRRNRMPLACTVCRKRKVKCDRSRPACKVCTKYKVAHLCQYQQPTWANSNSEDLKQGKFAVQTSTPSTANSIQAKSSENNDESSKRAKIEHGFGGGGDNQKGYNVTVIRTNNLNAPGNSNLGNSNTNANNNTNTITFTDNNSANNANANTNGSYPFMPSYDSPSSDLLHRAVSHIGSNERSFISPVNKPSFSHFNPNSSNTNGNNSVLTTQTATPATSAGNSFNSSSHFSPQRFNGNPTSTGSAAVSNDDNKPVMTELQMLKEKIKQIEASISGGGGTNDSNSHLTHQKQQQQQQQRPPSHYQTQQSLQLPRLHSHHDEELMAAQTAYSQGSASYDGSTEPNTRKGSISSSMVLPPIQNWKSNQANQSTYYQYQAASPQNPALLGSYQSSTTNKNYNILPPLVPFPMVPAPNSHNNNIPAASPSPSSANSNQYNKNSAIAPSSNSPPPSMNMRTGSPIRQIDSNNISTVLPPLQRQSNNNINSNNINNTVLNGASTNSISIHDSAEAKKRELIAKGVDFKSIPGMPKDCKIVPLFNLKDSIMKPNSNADDILIASADRSNEIKHYLTEHFKALGIEPDEILNLQEGYAPIHARESRVKNHGALSWITILKKDPFLKMMWFKLLEFKKSQKVKLVKIQRKSLTSHVKKESNEHTFRDRLLEQEGIVDMQPYEQTDNQQSTKGQKSKSEEGEQHEEDGDIPPHDNLLKTFKDIATKYDQEADSEIIANAPEGLKKAATNASSNTADFLEKAISKDKDSSAVLNIVKILPKRKVIWLLIDHFFNYNYAFLPYVDEETFINDVENIIGPRSYENVDIQSVHIPRRSEFANIGLLLVILRLSYLSLLQNYDSEYIPKKTEDEEYLLRNPIDVEVITVAQLCLNQFKLSTTCSLSIFQCTLFMRLYNGYAPEESDLGDSGDPQIFTGMLIEMATVIGLNRDPDVFTSGNITPKFANLWRKLWYCLVASDNAQCISMCNPRMIDPNFYDTKLPEFSEEASNVSNLELEKHVIMSIRSKFELNSKMADITRCILNIRHPPTIFELSERIFTLESILSESASILDLMIPASENKVLNMLRLRKMIGHFESMSLIHSLLYRIFLHYDSIGNIKACRFICEKILSLIVVIITVFNELLKYGPKYFGPYTDLYLTRTLEASMHKCLHFQLSLFSRCLIFMQTNKNRGGSEEEIAETAETIKSVMNDCVLKNVKNYIKGLSLISGRYYHAWRMSKAQNFILYLIQDHDFIMAEFNKLAKADPKGLRIIPKYSLFEGYSANDFRKLKDAFDVEKYLDSQGISIVNDEFVFHSRDAKQTANESIAAATLISVANNTPASHQNGSSYDDHDHHHINGSGHSDPDHDQNHNHHNHHHHDDGGALYAPSLKSREDVDNFWMELLNKKSNVESFGNSIDFDEQYNVGGYNYNYNYDSNSHSMNNDQSGNNGSGNTSNLFTTNGMNDPYGNTNNNSNNSSSSNNDGNNFDGFWFQNDIDVEQLPGYGLHDTDLLFNSNI